MPRLVNNFFFRLTVIIFHALVNFFVVSYCMKFDITGGWLSFLLFAMLCIVLLVVFIIHLLSFLQFLKTNTI